MGTPTHSQASRINIGFSPRQQARMFSAIVIRDTALSASFHGNHTLFINPYRGGTSDLVNFNDRLSEPQKERPALWTGKSWGRKLVSPLLLLPSSATFPNFQARSGYVSVPF